MSHSHDKSNGSKYASFDKCQQQVQKNVENDTVKIFELPAINAIKRGLWKELSYHSS